MNNQEKRAEASRLKRIINNRIRSDALMLLEKCLSSDKLTMPIEIDRKRHKGGRFRIESGVLSNSILAIEDTLPLAICQFARKLFEK